MRWANSVRLSHKTKEAAIAVEVPGTSAPYNFEAVLIVTVKDFVSHAAIWSAVDERQRLRAVPLHVDDGDDGISRNATHAGIGLVFF